MKARVFLASLLVGALPWLLSIPSAQAREPKQGMSEDDRRARELFLAGDAAYAEGRYEEAVAKFEEAYRLSERPLLLFNLANAYERLGRYADAAEALERYLPEAKPEETATLEKRVESLKARAAEVVAEEDAQQGSAPETQPPALPPPAEAPAEPAPPTLGYVLIGAGGVAIAAGAVFGVIALGARSDADASCSDQAGRRLCSEGAADAIDNDRTFSTLADVGFAVGIVSAAIGVTIVLGSSEGEADTKAASLGIHAGPRPAGGEVRLEARF